MQSKYEIMLYLGRYMKALFEYAENIVVEGITTKEIDNLLGIKLKEYNLISAPISMYNFPGNTCISVNECACHGIPNEYKLKMGDIINIDISFKHKDYPYYIDAGRNFYIYNGLNINKNDIEALNLMYAVERICKESIKQANIKLERGEQVDYNFFGEVMDKMLRKEGRYVPSNVYGGHVIGEKLHLPPFIPNHSLEGQKTDIIKELDTFCVEPIITFKTSREHYFETVTDGWFVNNKNKQKTAHYENTYIMHKNKIESVISTV